MLNRVGMSVEPWMLAWPRRARMPPPGRPMLPSSSWMIEAPPVLQRLVTVDAAMLQAGAVTAHLVAGGPRGPGPLVLGAAGVAGPLLLARLAFLGVGGLPGVAGRGVLGGA